MSSQKINLKLNREEADVLKNMVEAASCSMEMLKKNDAVKDKNRAINSIGGKIEKAYVSSY
jgi:hypothetical protein